jgi:hypothetical protein
MRKTFEVKPEEVNRSHSLVMVYASKPKKEVGKLEIHTHYLQGEQIEREGLAVCIRRSLEP